MSKASISPILVSAVLLVACGGGDDNTDQGVASIISSDEGGSLRIEGTETGVTFPEGAVQADTEIRLRIGSAAEFSANETALDDVMFFEPAMSLAVPASISMQLDENFDASQRVHLEQFVDGVWLRPELSSLEIGSGGVAYGQLQLLVPTAIVVEATDTPR
jgi:hypothetical protein